MKDILEWSPLQTSVTIAIANAKIAEFEAQACRIAELVKLGLLSRAEAGDILHEAAIYNQLAFEYGEDLLQNLMGGALHEAAA